MKNKICARCKKPHNDAQKVVPGPSLGAMIVDQVVCANCFDKHHDSMAAFWLEADSKGAQDCPLCRTELTRQNSKPAYRRSSGGSVDMCVICETCHSEYRKLCASAAAK